MIGKQFAHLNSPHREKALSYNIPIWFVLLTQKTKRSESMPRPDPIASDADALIDALIDREGRYINHPADRGGATCWGITEAESGKTNACTPITNAPLVSRLLLE